MKTFNVYFHLQAKNLKLQIVEIQIKKNITKKYEEDYFKLLQIHLYSYPQSPFTITQSHFIRRLT